MRRDGRQAFREGRTKHDVARLVKCLDRPRPRAAEVEIAVDVVFDHGHATFGGELCEPALVFVGHDAAERVAGIGDQQAGGDPALAGGQIERFDRQAGVRISGYFEGPQAERLKQLQHQVIAG
jgi:hypothetical protein